MANVVGLRRAWFGLRMKAHVLFYFLPELLGNKISLQRFAAFIRRLLYFVGKMEHNKFVRIGRNIRIDLYIPGYPSPAFFTACRKFLDFGEKLPCTTVLISITSACRCRCAYCYQKLDQGQDADIAVLAQVVRKLQDQGMAFFNLEGGEPFLVYDRLKKICSIIDQRSEIWINSTGDGITAERLRELKALNVTAIMFSLHAAEPEAFNAMLGNPLAWRNLCQAVECCHQTGMTVAFNVCLQIGDFADGRFEKIMEQAKAFGAAIIQLIKPKPAGGQLGKAGLHWTAAQLAQVRAKVTAYNQAKAYRDYPAISAQIIEESPEVFGCTAGGTDRFYINAKGDVQPCEFLNLSFGNILRDDFDAVYRNMRECFSDPGEEWLCEKYTGEIMRSMQEQKLATLPLAPEPSAGIYRQWDRGKKTELYQKLKKMR